MKNKVMFFYLNTGGGHYSPAKALSDYLLSNNSDLFETHLIDGLQKSSTFAKLTLEGGYRFLQNNAQWFYELIYLFHKVRFIAAISNWLVSKNTKKYLTEIITQEKPTTIVILHFFMIKPILKILKEKNISSEVFVLVTDPYTAHPLWYVNKKVDFIVFSDELKTDFISKGINEKNITVFPFVINNKYSNTLNYDLIEKLKKNYSLKHDKTVLIIGGADGLKNGKELIIELNKKVKEVNIIIVCGRNESLYREITDLKLSKSLDNLIVLGFADNVYELINLADLVITKCGASTIMEILLLGKIPLINSYLWEQEKGNKDFVVKNNLGFYIKESKNVSEKVFQLFSDSKLMKEYETNINNKGLKNGLVDVGLFIQQISTSKHYS
jgi:processive 1,2-diacylglycerol beta-glucosyltransferase/1,2-diacylglycerol 3-beta-galactosyltransferase